MKDIKDELQHITLGDEPAGQTNHLKKIQVFLRRHAETGNSAQKQQRFKGEETAALINFAQKEKLFYEQEISEEDYIGSGAEQRVYRHDDAMSSKLTAAYFTSIG